jgi:proline iminopeptidase
LPRSLLAAVLLATTAVSPAHSLVYSTGTVHTLQVDIGYETFGVRGTALPIIAVSDGPGFSHAYMMMNDLWQQVAQHCLVILYHQRGTGASKHMQPCAPQLMDAQVADLEALRVHLGLEKFALLGDSYVGMLSIAYAAAHPEHVAKLILSDSPGPSWKSWVHLLPQAFPDIEEEDAAEAKKRGPGSDAAARAGIRNLFRMIFYSPEKRDAYMAHG